MEGFRPHSGHYTFHADSRSVSLARHAVTGFAREHGVPGDVLESVALAVSEACTNVVVHAYRDSAAAGSISVGLELEERSLHVQVGDDGVGMGPRTDSPGLGLGLPIIAKVADGFAVEPGPRGGTELCMRFDLLPPLAVGSPPLVA
jgi:anti-sigma regulatory factor (Ser/Thr protein kinase)